MCLEKFHLFYSAHFENPHFASGDQIFLGILLSRTSKMQRKQKNEFEQ